MKKLKKIYSYIIVIIFSSIVILACKQKDDGLFGSSKTKEEAKANGTTVSEYLPNKKIFNLFDSTILQIDTAWTEVSFTYKDGKRILDANYGYLFSIPFKKQISRSFTFSFSLADTLNRMFTNGMDEDMAQLCPRVLHDTMKVLLEQRDPDTLGWRNPIITDTIVFVKVKK